MAVAKWGADAVLQSRQSGMEARRATADDIEAIAETQVRAWQEAYVGQVAQEYLDSLSVEQRVEAWTGIHAATDWPARGLLVVTDEGVVVGFAHVCPSRDDDLPADTGEVTAIYLRQAVWGRGAGRLLMDAALAELRAAGGTSAILWVLDTNERARGFYEAVGWRAYGAEKVDTIGGQELSEVRYRSAL